MRKSIVVALVASLLASGALAQNVWRAPERKR